MMHCAQDIVPWVRGGGRPGDPSWTSAFPENLYTRYKIGGDLTPARTYWPALMSYFDNMADRVKKSGLKNLPAS